MFTFYMSALLKKCPRCGKRFEVERQADVDRTENETVTVEKPSQSMTEQTPSRFVASAMGPAVLSQPPQQETIAAEKEVQTRTYVCKNCGYTWSEDTVKYKDERGHPLPGDTVITEGAP